MRTVVTFESASFNTTESRDYFINPGCFGDDACRWLISRLREAGVSTDPYPDQEDFGWYFNFTLPEGEHCCVVGFRPGGSDSQPGIWIAWLERKNGFLRALTGARKRAIAASAVSALHAALSSPEVSHIRWHDRKDFDTGRDDRVSREP